ncbi:MAG: helix-turn-helix transcriptional regulator [Microbacteriaceae bacterium]
MPANPSSVPVEERLFSLVLALLATETGLTKNEILSTVQGYRQRFSPGGDNANLDRLFERDKDDIRELGVPLETIEAPGQSGNNHALRYRIVRGSYELPSDLVFSSEETALLGLAAMVWREGSMSEQSRRAMLKLRSLDVAAAEPVLGYLPNARVRDASFEPLTRALERKAIVRFSYLKPGDAHATERTVAPLAVVQHQGRWHLFAYEPGTGRTKTFLLRRIVSAVTVTAGKAGDRPADQAERALEELERVWQENAAELEVLPGSDADSRLRKRRGAAVSASGVLVLNYTDLNVLADELAGFGPEVMVLTPPELRSAVLRRLQETVVAHAGESSRPEAADG